MSNSIGSNVFDVLLGLALPWFIKTTFVDYGSVVSFVNSISFSVSQSVESEHMGLELAILIDTSSYKTKWPPT